MKNILNMTRALLLLMVVLMVSCNVTELDLADNPNQLRPDQASADFLLNSIQHDFAWRVVEPYGRNGAEVVRIDYMNGRDYANAYSAISQDAEWRSSYQRLMYDIKAMNAITEETGLKYHTGMGQVMQAYTMMTLVDFYGDVPYTEAFLGSENLNPAPDAGSSVYAAAIALLDAAIANFAAGDALAEPQYDFYYGGTWDNWIKAANTLKMKAYMTTRLVDAGALASFDAIVASGDYITANSEDFQFRWGTNEVQPDTRHPRYSGSYTSTGGGDYMSNSLMAYMLGNDPGGYLAPNRFDPRMFFYFYRQVSSTPGIDGAPADEETLECGLQTAPTHYAGYTFCGVARGYWGRDHGNDNGIPPDGFLRTLAGSYPAGGRIDDLTYSGSANGAGDGGAGITPVMLASWADFMIAERQMLDGDEASAKTSVFNAVAKSIDKVTNFGTRTDRFEWIFGTLDGGPAIGAELSDYIGWFTGDLDAEWDAADTEGRWNILSWQYFVALYGNGIDGYNYYRRTGYPTNLQPNIEPDPGGFIRSFYYPANAANTNQSITQKSGVGVQVFWDTNPASPGFPVSN
jgi:hypothetical protein